VGKTALITGVTGQDGAYLTEHLAEQGYRVVGLVRRSASQEYLTERLKWLKVDDKIELLFGDLLDLSSLIHVMNEVKPDEVYNLAAQTFVETSFTQPLLTGQVTGLGATNLLEAVRLAAPGARFYQASSSEMYGKVQEPRQSETTPFYPRSPYAVAKLYAHWITVNYRESYGIHACSGILFNHESPLRGREFVTRKITSTMAGIAAGSGETLQLGNMDAKRDWGFAGDYVDGMARMLQTDAPDDFVLATNRTTTVRRFVELTAEALGVKLAWEGEGENTKALDPATGKTVVAVDPRFFRPAEVDLLIGDPSKAKEKLGWAPKTSLEELVVMMAEADARRLKTGGFRF
jgi:GDPmannose 4,6-dehydratase